jgi:hypothetical protein
VGLRASLDGCGKSRPAGIQAPDRPAHRQLLYRLCYPAPELREGGVNDAETCGSDIRLYLFMPNVHLFVS